MIRIIGLSILALLFIGCGGSNDSSEASSSSSSASSASAAQADSGNAVPENPVSVVDGVTVVQMTGNDQMKYNLESFSVPAGGEVRVVFRNIGKMPKAAMGHNVVFLAAGADPNTFVAAAASARDNDYIPAELQDQILATTALLGPGESDTIEFRAPEVPGDYVFLCSFPAHLFAGMRGIMTVD